MRLIADQQLYGKVIRILAPDLSLRACTISGDARQPSTKLATREPARLPKRLQMTLFWLQHSNQNITLSFYRGQRQSVEDVLLNAQGGI